MSDKAAAALPLDVPREPFKARADAFLDGPQEENSVPPQGNPNIRFSAAPRSAPALPFNGHLAACRWDDEARTFLCVDGCDIKRLNDSVAPSLSETRPPEPREQERAPDEIEKLRDLVGIVTSDRDRLLQNIATLTGLGEAVLIPSGVAMDEFLESWAALRSGQDKEK